MSHAPSFPLAALLDALDGIIAGVRHVPPLSEGRDAAIVEALQAFRATLQHAAETAKAAQRALVALREEVGLVLVELHQADQLAPRGEVREASVEFAIKRLRRAVL
jgi:tRNA C32,U32 (ribose-2'-O)-methylase TrmJ